MHSVERGICPIAESIMTDSVIYNVHVSNGLISTSGLKSDSERSTCSTCVIVPNFMAIGQTTAEIWWFFNFQDGGGRHLEFLGNRCLSCLWRWCIIQDAKRIKTKLRMQVGLDPRHTVLDGDPALPPPQGHSPQFLTHICCGQMAAWMKIPLGKEVGHSRSDIVLDGDPPPLPQNWGRAPQFSAHIYCA